MPCYSSITGRILAKVLTTLLFLVARTVNLFVAFGFLLLNFGRWCERTNAILTFYDCRLSGGNI